MFSPRSAVSIEPANSLMKRVPRRLLPLLLTVALLAAGARTPERGEALAAQHRHPGRSHGKFHIIERFCIFNFLVCHCCIPARIGASNSAGALSRSG
jgi:hypothetical protein